MAAGTMKFQTKNYYGEITPDTHRGWFDHEEYGDEYGGGLWFDNNMNLTDYDGVIELPKEVIQAIRDLGFHVGEEFE